MMSSTVANTFLSKATGRRKANIALGSLTGSTALTNDVALGSGQVQWVPLLMAAQKSGIKYYFIEDESPTVLEQLP
jgi:hypothetical protein